MRVRPDCIILNGSNELKLAGILGRALGVPKIIYRRGNAERVKAHFLNRLLIRSITHLIANSSFVEPAKAGFQPGSAKIPGNNPERDSPEQQSHGNRLYEPPGGRTRKAFEGKGSRYGNQGIRENP